MRNAAHLSNPEARQGISPAMRNSIRSRVLIRTIGYRHRANRATLELPAVERSALAKCYATSQA